MPKGQQRSNREAKKPKKAKSPAAPSGAPARQSGKGSAFVPVKPK